MILRHHLFLFRMDLDSLKILLSKHNQYCERLCHELDYGSDINSIRVRDFARKDWVRTDNHNLNLSNSILAKKSLWNSKEHKRRRRNPPNFISRAFFRFILQNTHISKESPVRNLMKKSQNVRAPEIVQTFKKIIFF